MKKLFYLGLALTCTVCIYMSVNSIGKTNQLAKTIIGQTVALAINETSDIGEYVGALVSDCEVELIIEERGRACLSGRCISVSRELEVGSKFTCTINGGEIDCEIFTGTNEVIYDCEETSCMTSWEAGK